jgi:flap endonuclease-1
MGTSLNSFVDKEEIDLEDLAGYGEDGVVYAAIDTYQWMHQFKRKIPSYGEDLVDDEGRVTSHLSGLYYRTMNLLEHDVRPIFIWEGGYPELKQDEIDRRREKKEKQRREYEIAKEAGIADEIDVSPPTEITDEMVQTAKDLMDALGCPSIVPPGEGEAQAAMMALNDQVDIVISTDYDVQMYGAPYAVHDLTSTGGKMIDLPTSLENRDLSQTQIMWIGLLMGTDYNDSPYGVGGKTAEKWVCECDSLGEIIDRAYEKDDDIDPDTWRAAWNEFASPDVDLDLEHDGWSPPQEDLVNNIMVDRHGFDRSRITSKFDDVDTVTSGQSSFSDF